MADESVLFDLGGNASGGVDAIQQLSEALGQFISSLKGVSDQLPSLDTSLGELGAKLGETGSQVERASEQVGGLRERLSGLSDGFVEGLKRATEFAAGMLEFQAFNAAFEGVSNFLGNMMGMNAQFENLTITLKNFVGAKQAADITDWTKAWAQNIPFTTASVEQTVVAITALQENAEQVVPALATVASQMGTDLPTATQAYVDAVNGRWIMLQNQLHITKEELVPFGLEMDKQGHVLNDSFVPAFQKFAETKFPTALSDNMHSLSGMLAEADDKIQLLAMDVGEPLFQDFEQGLGKALDWVSDPQHEQAIDNIAAAVGQGLATGFEDLGSALERAWPYLQDVWNIADGLVGGSFTVLMRLVQTGAQWWRDFSGGVQTVVTPLDGVAGSTGKLAGNLSHIPETLQSFTTQVQNLAGPLTPLKTTIDGLGQDLQNLVQFFEPVPEKTQMVTEKTKEWIDTGDGVGKWVSVTKQVNEVTPGQDSPFVQWLESIGDAFAKGFGDDSKHTKLQEFAQALSDLVSAIKDLASENGQAATAILQGIATAVGGAAGKLADFFGVLQKNKVELEVFKDTLNAIELIIAGKLVFSLGSSLVGAVKGLYGGVTDAYEGVSKLVTKYLDWVRGSDEATTATNEAGEAIQTAGEEAQAAASEGIQSATEGMQQLGSQVQQTGEQFAAFPEELNQASTALQLFVDGGVQDAWEGLFRLQEQKDALGEDFAGVFSGQVVEADNALNNLALQGADTAETKLQNLLGEAQTTGEDFSGTFVEQVGEAQTALLNLGDQAETTKGQLLDLQDQETSTGTFSELTFTPEMNAATTALQEEGAAAEATSTQMQNLAASEEEAGAAGAGTTAGAGAAAGAGDVGAIGTAAGNLFVPLILAGLISLGGSWLQDASQWIADQVTSWVTQQLSQMGLSDTFGDTTKKGNDSLAMQAQHAHDVFNQVLAEAQAYLHSINETFDGLDLGNVSDQLYHVLSSARVTFDGIKESAASDLGSVQDILTTTFTNLTGQGYTWGNTFTQAFANGIASALGSVDNSASQVMQHVHRYVGVESPTEAGPGTRLMEWGPNLTRAFAGGMLSELPMLDSAAHTLMAQVERALAPTVSGVSAGAYTSVPGGGGLGNNAAVLSLLQQIAANGARQVGSLPVASATTGSVYNITGPLTFTGQQITSMEALAMALYSYLNRLSGNQAEYAGLGYLG